MTSSNDIALKVEELLSELLGGDDFGSWVNGEILVGGGDKISLINPATAKELMAYQDATTTNTVLI